MWRRQGSALAAVEQADVLGIADGDIEERGNGGSYHNGIELCRTSRHARKSTEVDWAVN